MVKLQWGLPGTRAYESGLDQGVLYLPSGEAIPWNGLTAIEEDAMPSGTPLYFNGIKYFDDFTRQDFAGILKAYTYPDQFLDLEGIASMGDGLSAAGQPRKKFNLSYRTRKSNDTNEDAGYKIHILYNLVATPQDTEWATISDSIAPNEFGWQLSSSPELIAGYAPTSHAIIDTTLMRKELLQDLEDLLYGSFTSNPSLPPLADLTTYVDDWTLMSIVDNGDGTWTASTTHPGLIADNGDGTFVINDANASYSDANTYQISDIKA